MVEIFNSVTNIAEQIEKDVFLNYNNFCLDNQSRETIKNNVLKYCKNIIETEFKYDKNIKGLIDKETQNSYTINNQGKYLISYVAIDNIDLIDLNFSLGTIFGVYEQKLEANNLKAVIYITYGPTFQLVFASKDEGVKYFSNEHGEFIQQDSLQLKEKGKINSPAGIRSEFTREHIDLLDSFFNEGYRLRLSNSLALDTHQILFKQGGIFSSPATKSNPQGTLDVIFEAFPIAFIMELANGAAIDGKKRILDIKSPALDQKTPIYFGSKTEITKVQEILS